MFYGQLLRDPNTNAKLTVFTTRLHASVVYAVVVCLSVCIPQVGVLLKRLNVESRKIATR